jgi:hypothetical protein
VSIADSEPRATLSALLLEVSRAEFMERNHQRSCRARADERDCQSCLEYESEWLAADYALSAFLVEAPR